MARVSRSTQTVTLASGGSANTKPVNCIGAKRVHIAVSCDVTHQLTAGNVRAIMSDGKVVTLTPAVFPAGSTAVATHDLNAAGVITSVDLSSASNHRAVVVRSVVDVGGPYGESLISGMDYCGLALTKAATAGDAVYTVVTTVIWD